MDINLQKSSVKNGVATHGNDLHGTVTGASVENAPSNDDGLVYEEGTWTPTFPANTSSESSRMVS